MKNYFTFEVTDYFLENLPYYIKEYPVLKNKIEKVYLVTEKGTDEFQNLTIKVNNLVKPFKKGMYIITNEKEVLDVIIQDDLTKFLRKNKNENITIY